MAVGTPANLTSGLNTTDASSFATAAFTPTAGAKLLAWVNVGHRTITPSFPTSLSGHSITWTKIVDLTTTNNTWNCSLWEAVASGSPSSGTLTFNLGATAESCTWRVVEATGAQVVQSKTLTTSAADPSLTLNSAIGAGGVTLGFLMNNNATTTITAGSGYTDLGSQQSTSTAPVFKGAAEYNMTGTTTVAYTAAGTVVRGMVGVELGPSLTQVTATRATTWNTKAAVSGTRATTWDALAATSSTRATTWDVLTPATATRATTWDVLAAVSSTRATTWNVRAVATSTRATTWRVRSAVTGSRATSWDVLTPVTGSRATTWRVRAAVSGTRATTWRVRAAVTGTRATTWDVLTVASGTRATTWRVLAQATGQRATTWNVASSLLSVTTTRPTTWRVLARATSTRSTTWDVLGGVTGTRATSWRVRAPVTTSRATTWRVLQAATSSRGTTWRTLERITAARATSWNVAALPGGTIPNIGSVTVDPPQHAASADAPTLAVVSDVASLTAAPDRPRHTSEA